MSRLLPGAFVPPVHAFSGPWVPWGVTLGAWEKGCPLAVGSSAGPGEMQAHLPTAELPTALQPTLRVLGTRRCCQPLSPACRDMGLRALPPSPGVRQEALLNPRPLFPHQVTVRFNALGDKRPCCIQTAILSFQQTFIGLPGSPASFDGPEPF
uniref:Uncharacterized protein n=1 Tax=Myotis myotis TaxID=51298 RepID=A0A7J7RUM2_MYOMY|nr:hypothetical protein mMyoMyo1_010141 [Myotis myotis]